jgi:arginase family enzyme
MRVCGEDVHILYIDGDVDGAAPQPERCLSAAAMALWLTTQASPFWVGPPIKPSQVTVIGCSDDLRAKQMGMPSLSLAEVRRKGPGEAARQVLQALPASGSILLHFDIDVLSQHEMPAAYFPHTDGLSLAEGQELLGAILADSRVRIIEVTEYASLRDLDQRYVSKIVELLADGLKRHRGFC